MSNTNLEFNYKNDRNIYKDKTNEKKTLINVNRQDEYNLNKYNIQSKDSSLNNARFISINDMSIDKNNKNLSSLQKLKMSLIK